jgi:hypothetical protein
VEAEAEAAGSCDNISAAVCSAVRARARGEEVKRPLGAALEGKSCRLLPRRRRSRWWWWWWQRWWRRRRRRGRSWLRAHRGGSRPRVQLREGSARCRGPGAGPGALLLPEEPGPGAGLWPDDGPQRERPLQRHQQAQSPGRVRAHTEDRQRDLRRRLQG